MAPPKNEFIHKRKLAKDKRDSLLREVLGVLLIGVDAFLVVSLVTYHRDDPSFNNTGGEIIHNLAGLSGAFFADVMFQALGLAAAWVPMVIASMSFRLLRKNTSPLFLEQIISLPMLALVTAVLSTLLVPPETMAWLPAGPGGVAGLLGASSLKLTLGVTISLVLLGTLGLISLFIFTHVSPFDLFVFSSRRDTGKVVKENKHDTGNKHVAVQHHEPEMTNRHQPEGIKQPPPEVVRHRPTEEAKQPLPDIAKPRPIEVVRQPLPDIAKPRPTEVAQQPLPGITKPRPTEVAQRPLPGITKPRPTEVAQQPLPEITKSRPTEVAQQPPPEEVVKPHPPKEVTQPPPAVAQQQPEPEEFLLPSTPLPAPKPSPGAVRRGLVRVGSGVRSAAIGTGSLVVGGVVSGAGLLKKGARKGVAGGSELLGKATRKGTELLPRVRTLSLDSVRTLSQTSIGRFFQKKPSPVPERDPAREPVPGPAVVANPAQHLPGGERIEPDIDPEPVVIKEVVPAAQAPLPVEPSFDLEPGTPPLAPERQPAMPPYQDRPSHHAGNLSGKKFFDSVGLESRHPAGPDAAKPEGGLDAPPANARPDPVLLLTTTRQMPTLPQRTRREFSPQAGSASAVAFTFPPTMATLAPTAVALAPTPEPVGTTPEPTLPPRELSVGPWGLRPIATPPSSAPGAGKSSKATEKNLSPTEATSDPSPWVSRVLARTRPEATPPPTTLSSVVPVSPASYAVHAAPETTEPPSVDRVAATTPKEPPQVQEEMTGVPSSPALAPPRIEPEEISGINTSTPTESARVDSAGGPDMGFVAPEGTIHKVEKESEISLLTLEETSREDDKAPAISPLRSEETTPEANSLEETVREPEKAPEFDLSSPVETAPQENRTPEFDFSPPVETAPQENRIPEFDFSPPVETTPEENEVPEIQPPSPPPDPDTVQGWSRPAEVAQTEARPAMA
ncbi:MAG: DNA translocase FtsK 4TM domain-containing protein, partial [Magnetococcales bacterium]|nr:DNA translocase FtsK 4TM domain-containing protein [Magnetococcales bacterium]